MVETLNKQNIRSEYDLIIIGGGYIGAWATYFASQYCPDWHILLVDAQTFGSGATRYAADLDFPNNRTNVHRHLSRHSRNLIQAARQSIPSLPFVDCPAYLVGGNQELANYKINHPESPDASWNGASVSLSGFPFRRPNDQYLLKDIAAQRTTDKSLIPQLLDAALALNSKISFRERLGVSAVRRKGEEYELSFGQGIQKRAKKIISAVGPWAVEAPWLSTLRSQLRVKKVVAYSIELPPKVDDTVVYLLNEGAFLLPQQEKDRWLFSVTSAEWDCPVREDALTFKAVEQKLAKGILTKYLPEFLPYLSEGLIFCDAYPKVGHPILQSVDGTDNHLYVGGCSGSGFRLSPAMAYQAIQKLKQSHPALVAQQTIKS
ncbi:MAG: FAD-dependent oxidoreductase [Bacteroidota bacterium]